MTSHNNHQHQLDIEKAFRRGVMLSHILSRLGQVLPTIALENGLDMADEKNQIARDQIFHQMMNIALQDIHEQQMTEQEEITLLDTRRYVDLMVAKDQGEEAGEGGGD